MASAISAVHGAARTVFVASQADSFSSEFALRCGERLVPFSPSERPLAVLLDGVNSLVNGDFATEPQEWAVLDEAEGLFMGRNVNPAWTVRGQNTGYVAVPANIARATLRYVDPDFGESLPAIAGQEYTAYGAFALHYGDAEVRLTALDARGLAVTTEATPVLREFHGGEESSGYAELAVSLLAPPRTAAIRFEVVFLGHCGRTRGVHPPAWIFLTRCGLHAGGSKRPHWRRRPSDFAARVEVATGKRPAALYEATVDVDAAWSAASLEIVPLHDGDADAVEVCRLPDVTSVIASVGPMRGNALDVTVEGYADAIHTFIDGEQAALLRPQSRSRRRDRVIVPRRFLDGMQHSVEVCDQSGLRVLARSVVQFPRVATPWASLQEHAGRPLPGELAPAAAHRYRSLKGQLARLGRGGETGAPAGDAADFVASLSHAHTVMEGGLNAVTDFPPLTFPRVEAPQVSVIVPVHNKFNVTYYCMCALLLAPNVASFEVIVVDDGSDDETVTIQDRVANITVVRNETALGFVGACNRGAAEANGDFIVLLNNDTEPTANWLDELLFTFARMENVGLAGSKLLYPDGRLQEAGGLVWNSANPWNYGRGANPWEPKFCYARQVDYVSGAALMVSRSVWEQVGGLSEEFAPAYFEDTDLAFKVRDAGYTTWFVPNSIVYHFEGVSNGTDTAASTGFKRFQELNRPKFRKKWISTVRSHGDEGHLPDLEKDRSALGRVLFVDHELPRPDRDAGGHAAVKEMQLVQSLGYKVTFAPENMAYLGHYSDDLNRLGVETIHAPFSLSVSEFLQRRGAEFDLVYITRYYVAKQVIPLVRRYAPRAKVAFNNADLHFLREMRHAALEDDQDAWNRVLAIRSDELDVMKQSDLVLSYNEVEHAIISSHNLGQTKVAKCPWVVDLLEPSAVRPFSERSGIAFLGGYRHPPNVEAVEFFVREVVPLIREKLPDAHFNIYGSAMPDSFQSLRDDFVRPIGYVDTVEEAYATNRLFVAPLLSGAGLKGKVVGAFAHGIPTILSPVAAEATGGRDGTDCRIAESADDWAASILELYESQHQWEQMSRSALALARRRYSFEQGRALMRAAFEELGLYDTRK